MSEHKIPIPSMIYNASVGGHVTNSQQIIDENLNREQNDINQETIGAVPYNSTTPNGMGRIVLKKTDNFKEVVEAQTNGNTIFVIKYDFTLTDNVTVPANCVLEFDGGSINVGDENANTIIGQDTKINAAFIQIFDTNIKLHGTWILESYYAIWQGLIPNNSNIDFGVTMTKILENIVMMFPRRIWSSGKSRSGINVILIAGQYYAATSVNLNTLTTSNPDSNNTLIDYSLDNVGIIGASKNSVQISSINNETFFVFDKTTPTSIGIKRIKNIIFREYHGGIRMHGATDLIIEDCSFFAKEKGIVLDLACNVTVRDCHFQCGTGISFTSTYAGDTTTTYVEHCWFQHCDLGIMAISHVWDANTIYGFTVFVKESIIEYCDKGFVLYDNIQGEDIGNHNVFYFQNCHFEINNGSEIYGGYTEFKGCEFNKATVDGVTDRIIVYNESNPIVIWEGKNDATWNTPNTLYISIKTKDYIKDYRNKYQLIHKNIILTYEDAIWKKLLLRYSDKSGNFYIGILEATGTGRLYSETAKIAGNITPWFADNSIHIIDGAVVEPKAELFGFGETWDYEFE